MFRMLTLGLAGVICGLLATPEAFAQEKVKVEGRVIDQEGKPVAGAEVANFWHVSEKNGKQTGVGAVKTDAEGRFALKLDFYGQDRAITAIDEGRKLGGNAVVSPSKAAEPVEIRLEPLVTVHGTFSSEKLGHAPTWTNVYLNLLPGKIRIAGNSSTKANFSLLMPPGDYDVNAYGSDVRGVHQNVTLKADQPDLDLGTIELPATVLGMYKGKELPPWKIIDARGVKKDVTLADYRGKWVLVDIWGYWCGPCVRQLGELIDFYDAHADHRDKFEIIAFHDGSVKDFSEMDAKTEQTKKTLWRGRDLPFPVLLDAPNGERGETVALYEIQSFPTSMLFDPEGKFVGEVSIEMLESKLPPLPLDQRIARAFDRDLAFGLSSLKLDQMPEIFRQFGRVPVKIDAEALKAKGIALDATIPLTLSGSISMRSWLELLLDPLNLEAVPDTEGITIRPKQGGTVTDRSKPQIACAERIEAKLKEKTSFDFKNVALETVAARFEQQTGENFVLDPAGRLTGKIDPEAKINGTARDQPLGEAINAMLAPLGLHLVVKDEVVVISQSSD